MDKVRRLPQGNDVTVLHYEEYIPSGHFMAGIQ